MRPIPLENRQIRTWSDRERAVKFGTSDSDGVFGGALPALTSRGTITSPIFDLKPWLRDEQSAADYDFGTPVDTSAACDLYDPCFNFLLYTRGGRLADAAGVANLRIWVMERGHPVDPQKATYYHQRREVTDQFIQEVNEGWLYTFKPQGMRFWSASMVLECLTATRPTVLVSLSMH